jgi:hypothetical protein
MKHRHSITPLLLLTPALLLGVASAQPVTARLEIPAAETHVIGDPLPLVWHFTNSTPSPLAFVWEACCRLNGRITVSQGGIDLPPIPPGPNSAHQFAKPAIIRPQAEQSFESLLADWVFLTNSGRYEIRGRYVGVVPEQKPPVPRSIELWRGQAETAPASVALLTVNDYLAQRDARVAKRGLDATLTGPTRLPPLGETNLLLRLRNTGSAPLSIRWPLEARLWIVDDAGLRVFRAPTKPVGSDELLTIAPGAERMQSFPVSAADLNGGRFGNYRVFVDFPGTNGQTRVPSVAHEIRWKLEAGEVAGLLNDAAAGSSVGARNAPLRLLRQYLASLEATLAGLPDSGLSEKAATLRQQLRLAACLHDLPMRAGRADLRIEVLAGGRWKFAEPSVLRCVTGPPEEQLRSVMGVRRHLGLELAAKLLPSDDATVADVLAASRTLTEITGDFAAPRFIADAPTNVVPGSVAFPTAPTPANFILRLRASSGGAAAEVARKLMEGSTVGGMFQPEELKAASFQPVAGPESLETLCKDGKLTSVQVLVLADRSLRWPQIKPWLEPLLKHGWQFDLAAMP